MIKLNKTIKFDYFDEKFYEFAWKGEELRLIPVLISVYKGLPSKGYTTNINLYCSDSDSFEVLVNIDNSENDAKPFVKLLLFRYMCIRM